MDRIRQLGLLLLLVVVTVVVPRLSRAADEDALIKGVADFLLDRANDNYVYVFERKLKSSKAMQKYLPATLRVAKAGDLRSLLTNKAVWNDALEQDLEKGKRTLLSLAVSDLNNFIDKPCGKTSDNPPDALADSCTQVRDALKAATTVGTTPEVAFKERKSLAFTAFTAQGQIDLAKQVLSNLKSDLEQVGVVSCKKRSYTSCVIQILALIDAFAQADYTYNCFLLGNWCWNNQRDPKVREEDDDFKDFRRYALFFAQMADAADTRDPEQVKALLKSVTVPPVSFGIKREPHATRLLITSYLAGAWSRQTSASHQQTWGILAPVGVELSQARNSGDSMSLLISPLDFGYPLTLKMKNVDTTIKASDVVVPAIYVFYGMKNYPLAIGTGYSRGRSIDSPDQRVGRWVVLFAFDMPLFRLH